MFFSMIFCRVKIGEMELDELQLKNDMLDDYAYTKHDVAGAG